MVERRLELTDSAKRVFGTAMRMLELSSDIVKPPAGIFGHAAKAQKFIVLTSNT